jgi:transcriptional regulator with XRE-family HTH domain
LPNCSTTLEAVAVADLARVFADFVEAHLAGSDPDPWEYVGRVDEADREELEELIDAYYVDAPPRPWDAQAFRSSESERLVDAIDRSFRGQAGLWPAVLPRLRDRAKLRRVELVATLAEALGVADREEKVGAYYHQMEQGLLPSAGVSERVLERLARILGVTAESLRSAGRMLTPEVGEAEDAVYARKAGPSREWRLEHDEEAPPPGVAGAKRGAGRDEVDQLFTGGGSDRP